MAIKDLKMSAYTYRGLVIVELARIAMVHIPKPNTIDEPGVILKECSHLEAAKDWIDQWRLSNP